MHNALLNQLWSPYKKSDALFRLFYLDQAAKQTGTPLYFFSIYDVNFAARRIKGTYFNDRTRRWERKMFPLPDVLFDRCGGLTGKEWLRAKRIRQFFSSLQVKKLNALHNFDKWDTYRVLHADEGLRQHLPATRLYRNQQDMKSLLEAGDKVYLKAVTGNRGKKVMCVEKLPRGRYKYSYYHNRLVVGKCRNLKQCRERIRSFFRGRTCIVQQAIPLLQIDHCLVDMRAEVQRSGQNNLEIVGICVRVGQRYSPITIHSQSYPFEVFFRHFLRYGEAEIQNLRTRVEAFLVKVYQCIERQYGPFGEIGIDFGIDREGGIWFIECNAKSAKVSLKKAYDRYTLIRAFLNPFEYARYIHTQHETN